MSVQLHCGNCEKGCAGCTDKSADCHHIALHSCSGIDKHGKTIKLAQCTSYQEVEKEVDLARIQLTHCVGRDQHEHVVKLHHCYGEHKETDQLRS